MNESLDPHLAQIIFALWTTAWICIGSLAVILGLAIYHTTRDIHPERPHGYD